MENSSTKQTKRAEQFTTKTYRQWADLSEDVLITIFQKSYLKDRLKGAPLCCTSWYKASKHPSVWSDVSLNDFYDPYRGVQTWCSPRGLAEFVITRSQGLLTSITFHKQSSPQDFLLVAESCPKLKYFKLKIPRYELSKGKETIAMSISKLKELEGMEVEDPFISNEFLLQKIAECCPNFHKLALIEENFPCKMTEENLPLSSNTCLLIAKYLSKLKTLELKWVRIHRKDLLVILKGCLELENLDIRGSGKISCKDEILDIGRKRLKNFEWEDEVDESCSRCEDECEDFYSDDEDDMHEWPCKHTYEDDFEDYIDGTKEMLDELYPDDDYFSVEHAC
ncbi:hypothetical protein ACHQM5_014440 [Ranunculus cassubicifolius]